MAKTGTADARTIRRLPLRRSRLGDDWRRTGHRVQLLALTVAERLLLMRRAGPCGSRRQAGGMHALSTTGRRHAGSPIQLRRPADGAGLRASIRCHGSAADGAQAMPDGVDLAVSRTKTARARLQSGYVRQESSAFAGQSGDGVGSSTPWPLERLPTCLSPACLLSARAISHAGVRQCAGRHPAPVRSGPSSEGFACGGSTGKGHESQWHFLNSPCASCSKPAPTSATRRTAGTRRWTATSSAARTNIHIIDLSQTVPLLHQALVKVREVAAGGGRVLFVGTKRQASEPVATAAKRCAQYYVNHRWLGGTLTNWRTISELDRAPARARRRARRRRRRAAPRRSCCS